MTKKKKAFNTNCAIEKQLVLRLYIMSCCLFAFSIFALSYSLFVSPHLPEILERDILASQVDTDVGSALEFPEVIPSKHHIYRLNFYIISGIFAFSGFCCAAIARKKSKSF